MDSWDLWGVISECFVALGQEQEEFKRLGMEYAEKEAEYYRLKNLRTVQMLAEKHTATAIQLLIKGDRIVNDALLERNLAETLYKASHERILALKLQINIYEKQYEREYGNVH